MPYAIEWRPMDHHAQQIKIPFDHLFYRPFAILAWLGRIPGFTSQMLMASCAAMTDTRTGFPVRQLLSSGLSLRCSTSHSLHLHTSTENFVLCAGGPWVNSCTPVSYDPSTKVLQVPVHAEVINYVQNMLEHSVHFLRVILFRDEIRCGRRFFGWVLLL